MALTFAAFAFCLGTAKPATALTPPEEMVEKSRLTLQKLIGHPDVQELKRYLAEAKGVFIVPSLIKGAFIVGAEGGSGVLLVKGADGTWSSPAFFTLAAGSIGLQIGGQASEVVFTLMNWGAVDAVLDANAKLGGDLSIAVGPIGKGVEASTTVNFDEDIYAFSTAVGAFAGGALEGAAFIERTSWNDQYYDSFAPSRAVVIDRKFYNGHADPLRSLLP
ncbi:MAG: lipid-binding SYLF domain-containing protein [Kiloniellales bacterium]|nr:lipid-binding SYLF domain-containing protein [Kiloniellales bacterium]